MNTRKKRSLCFQCFLSGIYKINVAVSRPTEFNLEQNLHTLGKFRIWCHGIKFQLQCSSLQNLFPFFQKSFLWKIALEKLHGLWPRLNNFWEINSWNTTVLTARCCTFRRVRNVRNRFQPQTSLWNYEKAMLIKIVALFRNLLISSFDATIRVKRAFI